MTGLFDGTNWYCDIGGRGLGTAISVYMSVAKTITDAATEYPLTFNTELYDTLGEFDTSTYKFTATVAGKYLFTCEVAWTGCSNGDTLTLGLYKNGVTSGDWVFYRKVTALTAVSLAPTHFFAIVVDVAVGDWFVVQAMNSATAGTGVWGRSGEAKLAALTITQVQ